MKSRAVTWRLTLIALLAAIPIEVVNFWLFMPPLDVGLPDNAPWYIKWIALEWVLLHLPGIRAGQWLDRHGSPGHYLLPMFTAGYLDTALLLLLAVLTLRWLGHLTSRPAAEPN